MPRSSTTNSYTTCLDVSRPSGSPHVGGEGTRGQHPPAPLSGFMREQRPENRGAAVCVDCESNKEKVSQRLPCVRHVLAGNASPCAVVNPQVGASKGPAAWAARRSRATPRCSGRLLPAATPSQLPRPWNLVVAHRSG